MNESFTWMWTRASSRPYVRLASRVVGGCAATMALLTTNAFAQTNIAPGGTAYTWAHNTQATANSNRAAASGLNDGNTGVDVNLSGGKGETQTAYEAGGVLWPGTQTLGSVQFIAGTWQSSNDGAFCANLTLQTTLDGKTWVNSNWTVSPAYAYDRSSAAGVVYTFNGSPLTVLGVRVSGQAHCNGGNSDWSNVRELLALSNVADITPPTPPTNLTASATSAGQVSLSWTGSTDNVGVAAYQIFRNGGTTPVGQSMTTHFNDTSVAANTAYSYDVRAVDAAGNVSTQSNAVQVSTPAAAANLALSGIGLSAIGYSWAHNASATADSNRTPAPGLNDGNTTADVNLSGGVPETATLFEAGGVLWSSAQSIGQVQFIAGTWTSTNDGAFCANLTLQTTLDGTTWTNSSWPVSPAYAYDTSAVAGITYSFSGSPVTVMGVRVSGLAHCAGGNSDWSNVREVLAFGNAPPDTMPPTAPGNLTANATSSSQVLLSWTASSDNVGVAGYLVYRDGSQIATLGGSVLSHQDSGLTPSTSYTYTVKAQDAAGNLSAAANAVSVTTPTGTTGGGCTPDIPIPTAGGQTWPDSCTTGAMDSLGTLSNVSGDVILDQPGRTYSNVRVNGTIAVTACDVTLENVEVDDGIALNGGIGGPGQPDDFSIWLQQPANCNVTLDHVSVITKPAPNNYITTAVRVSNGTVTVTNSKFIGAQIAIAGAGTIRNNYAVLGATLNSVHNEVILEDGGTNGMIIEHNTFLNPNLQTSVLSLFTEFGTNSNFMVDNNLMAGGGWTCYCGDGATDNNGNPTPASNVSFINNAFWRLYYPNVGSNGPGTSYNSAGGGQWTNNLYMNADGTLTNQQVPQPPTDQPQQ